MVSDIVWDMCGVKSLVSFWSDLDAEDSLMMGIWVRLHCAVCVIGLLVWKKAWDHGYMCGVSDVGVLFWPSVWVGIVCSGELWECVPDWRSVEVLRGTSLWNWGGLFVGSDTLLLGWGSSNSPIGWSVKTWLGSSVDRSVEYLDGRMTSVGKVGVLKMGIDKAAGLNGLWLSSICGWGRGLDGEAWFRGVDLFEEVWETSKGLNWGFWVVNWLPISSFTTPVWLFMGLVWILNFTELMCVSVTGPLEFANGNLVGTAWFKPGLGESPVIVVLFFAPCTAGGGPAWMFTFSSVLSIVPLLTVRLVWFCFVVFGEGSAVFSVSLASVKRTEAVTGSLVEDKTEPFGPTV